MSIFPAYSSGQETVPADKLIDEEDSKRSATAKWLANNSFALSEEKIKEAIGAIVNDASDQSKSDTTSNSSSDTDSNHKYSSKSQRKHRKKEEEQIVDAEPILEFHKEDFFVHKEPARSYKTVDTLYRPACPRYHHYYHHKLGANLFQGMFHITDAKTKKKRFKRYYRQSKRNQRSSKNASLEMCSYVEHVDPLDENAYTLEMGRLNRRTMESPNDLDAWLQLIILQDRNPYKWSRVLLAEKKLDYVQRALVYHPRAESLYRIYIDTINVTYPSYEITKLLDKMLARDPHSYMLWIAQIMTTQGSMARCVLPDVLRIYERGMQKLHQSVTHKNNQIIDSDGNQGNVVDIVMLNLFHNCALFLRQAGMYEQFVALIKLALELNVSTDQFSNAMISNGEEQSILIEYEELVLQSGLPMNELWLRIERLRQGYNFLPHPPSSNCSDPQRMVFNEDICHYIYPLRQRDKAFELMLLVLRLLKLPFVQYDGLARRLGAKLNDIGDSDAIEDILAVLIRKTYLLAASQIDEEFSSGLFELAKEMSVNPTFLSNNLGHELYVEFLRNLLLNCAATVSSNQRIVFLVLWCRFERLLLVLQRYSGTGDGGKQQTIPIDYVKAGKKRFKALLCQPANRNVLHLYTELALWEYEAVSLEEIMVKTDIDGVCRTFDNIIVSHQTTTPEGIESSHLLNDEMALPVSAADLCYTHLMYAEVLVARGRDDDAAYVLIAYILGLDVRRPESKESGIAIVSASRKLAALQRITRRLDGLIAIEKNVNIMLLEQYLLPDFVVTLLRMRTLLQCLMGQKLEALAYLDRLLKTFLRNDGDRHDFLRESIQELYATIIQFPSTTCAVTPSLIGRTLHHAIEEYPRNLLLLQRCTTLRTTPWYRLRSILLRRNQLNILGISFLIAAARYRFLESMRTNRNNINNPMQAIMLPMLDSDLKHQEIVVRNRILSLFQYLTDNIDATTSTSTSSITSASSQNILQRNPLFWRFYIRCLTDPTTPFETSQRCLLTALDACPWSKSLYMDGALFVPQELPRLQDLMIEKQMRMYALPEELDILREK